MTVLVTGGAGYIGAPLCARLLEEGRAVRVLDALSFGQDAIAATLRDAGAQVVVGDVRDADARAAALAGVEAVVHLAAIVGDPACARDPDLADAVNLGAAHALIDEAAAAGVERFVMASTCSNYGRMADHDGYVTETSELAPVSLYARQKVEIERRLLEAPPRAMLATCVRFATIYGVAPRMRFDLTVNEFTRDLWAQRELEVFGEQFWRPYLHVLDAGRAVRAVLDANRSRVGGQVFNVGDSDENYRKLDLVEAIRRQTDAGSVRYVRREEDPRDYRVGFAKIADTLGFAVTMRVPDGIAEILAGLDAGDFGDPFDARFRNIA